MKTRNVLKILLMFVIVFTICSVSRTSNATITIEGNIYKFNHSDVIRDVRLFCINKGKTLPGGNLEYIETESFHFGDENTMQIAWAYFFARNQVRYQDEKYDTFYANPFQVAVWNATHNGRHGSIEDILQAAVNGEYKNENLETYKSNKSYYQIPEEEEYRLIHGSYLVRSDKGKYSFGAKTEGVEERYDFEDKYYKGVEGNNNNLQILKKTDSKGYDWTNEDNKLLNEAYKYARTQENVDLKNNDVSINNFDAVSIMEYDEKYGDVAIFGPYTIENCNYFAYNKEVIAGVTNILVKGDDDTELVINEDFILLDINKSPISKTNMEEFNQKVAAGFYVELLNPMEHSGIKLDVAYKGIECEATAHVLVCNMEDGFWIKGGEWYCDAHDTEAERWYLANSRYITTSQKSNTSTRKYKDLGTTQICSDCFEEESKWASMYCTKSADRMHHTVTAYVYKVYAYSASDYCHVKCGYNNEKTGWHDGIECGTSWNDRWFDYKSESQPVMYVESNFKNDEIHLEEEINVKPMLKEITIEKSDIITNELIDGAKFSGSISNIKSFYLDKQRTIERLANEDNTYSFTDVSPVEGKLSIYYVELADEEQPVVIKLTETEVPAGYVGIEGEVTITIDYLNRTATIDDGHKVAEGQMEEVVVDGQKLTRSIVRIDFKNDQKPQTKITLTKIDSDDENKPIQGVKFNGAIENAIKPLTNEAMTEIIMTTGEDGIVTSEEFMIDDITKPVVITLTEVEIPTLEGGFSYRPLNGPITIEFKYIENSEGNGVLKLDNWNYGGQEEISVVALDDGTKNVKINMNVPNGRRIAISGQVWLENDTYLNNKTNEAPNGILDEGEEGVPNVIVYLKNSEGSVVKTTVTDENGEYHFSDIDYNVNGYYVEFEYDGINYIRTVDGESNATENGREEFNNKFHTITNGTATDIDETSTTTLTYETETTNGIQKSTLITTGDRIVSGEEHSDVVLSDFGMTATSENIKTTTDGVNLGLVLRGTDLAASNKVNTARVTINGEETTYAYDSENNSIDVNRKSSEEVSYNLNIRKSDYTYRIKDYVNTEDFVEKEYTDNTENNGNTTGDELKVYVTYQVDLTNQSPETATVNQVVYNYDSRYVFNATETEKLNVLGVSNDTSANTLTINVDKVLEGKTTQSIYLVFELTRENISNNAEYYNAVEITSYTTDKGLIDVDSEPGNLNYNKDTHTGNFEDDSDEAGGVKVTIREDNPRTVSGYVFEDANQNGTMANDETKVNDVIVQLIELKTINSKQYEYIWQETVSGTDKVKRMKLDGQTIEEVTYTKQDGYYEFKEFIPGNYIVRFIYGDGTTYDLTNRVLKYNGQDYKSTIDSRYNEGTYNPGNYASGASVARDNEARRLETMSYTVDVDANKGILLKLLDVQTANGLNEVEKATIIGLYNTLYDPDISTITDAEVTKLLREQTLRNTWMCAETSRINVGVDSNVTLGNVYFGLAKRPAAEIELDKYVTGFKLTASNGQVLVNAKVDVEKYFEEGGNISDYIEGIRESLQAIDEYWKFEVDPLAINNVVDGSTLEFEYTVIVRNIGEKDYLSNTLLTAYGNNNYADYLKTTSRGVKTSIKDGSHIIGAYLGSYYYNGSIGSNKETLTEITDVRDYIRNDLKYISGTNDVAIYDEPEGTTHYVLNADYSLGTTTLSTVLKAGHTSGKLATGNRNTMYAVVLQSRTALSTAGRLDFYNYIAEVMSYTNAAGRRAQSSTPANAEIIDNEYRAGRAHEIDEAATADIQIGAKTGEDTKTPNVWLIVLAGVGVVIALGAYTTKKFITKK